MAFDPASQPNPITLSLPTHDTSPAEAAAGSLARPAGTFTPVPLVFAKSKAKVSIDAFEVLGDRVQLHLTAKGGTGRVDLASTCSINHATEAVESTGVIHPLVTPTDAKLEVPAGGSLDATLVFAGAVPAEVSRIDLTLGGGCGEKPLRHAFSVATVDPAPPAAQATLAGAGAAGSSVPSEPPAPAVSPSATVASVVQADVTPLAPSQAVALAPWVSLPRWRSLPS